MSLTILGLASSRHVYVERLSMFGVAVCACVFTRLGFAFRFARVCVCAMHSFLNLHVIPLVLLFIRLGDVVMVGFRQHLVPRIFTLLSQSWGTIKASHMLIFEKARIHQPFLGGRSWYPNYVHGSEHEQPPSFCMVLRG